MKDNTNTVYRTEKKAEVTAEKYIFKNAFNLSNPKICVITKMKSIVVIGNIGEKH